jgi:ribosomal protein S18 acetylase RimI-like enzyme
MYIARAYRDASDVERLKRVAARAFLQVPCHPYAGVEWVVFGPHGFPPGEIVRIWEDDRGETVGWVLLGSADSFDYRITPELLGTPLEETIIRWGMGGIRGWRKANNLDDRCVVECWDGDHSRAATLSNFGFAARETVGVVFTRPLNDEIPAPRVPGGWRVSGLDDAHIDSRAQTQYEAFAPGSRTTPKSWRYLMHNAPGYDRDLDNVAVSPEGNVCAAALVWLDSEGNVGEFEPVGTRPAHQRRGLGKAVLLRGLAKMRERGMRTAIVGTNATNTAAIALYRSVGFAIVNRVVAYEFGSSPGSAR